MSDATIKVPYDWRISAKKAGLTALKTLGGIAIGAVLQQLSNPDALAKLLRDFPAVVALAPAIAGGFAFAYNALKQKLG